MSRVALGLVAVVATAATPTTARGGPTTVTAEGGAEADTNVQRVESGREDRAPRIQAAVGRIGARIDHRGRLLGGGFSVAASSLARIVGDQDASTESIALASGDLRWLRALGARPVALGVSLTAADAFELGGKTGSRTFRVLGGDALLVLRGGDERTLTFAFGGRSFTYKPDHDYDWSGPTSNVRLDLTLWQPPGGMRSLELAATLGFEARSYESVALASACSDTEPPDASCFARTSLTRHDRYQRAGLELTFVGRVVATGGYLFSVTDSNSFGQSVVRHRVTLSTTTQLPWGLVGTVLGTLQIDQYLDGLLRERDLITQTFTSIEDENRSSLQVRLARPLSKTWSIESRAAIWRNFWGPDDTTFRRSLIYLGAVYTRR